MLHEHHFTAMNTDVGIWVWSAGPGSDPQILASISRAGGVFGRVEAELSRFRTTSALSQLNRAAGGGPHTVSPLLWTVLDSAFEAARDSGGVYDPTMCRAIERIGYDRSFERVERTGPEHGESGACTRGGWSRVRLDGAARSISLPADLALDLGGIAKGWTVDRVTLALAPLGPVLVDAGGDLRVMGTVDDEAWPIAVQHPFEPERDFALVRLRHGALATSSRGGRCWQRGTRMLHHVIDPRTGTSADSDLHAVTVHAPNTMTADIAAKVVLILGRERGTRYLLKRGLSGLLIGIDDRETIVGHFPKPEVVEDVPVRCV